MKLTKTLPILTIIAILSVACLQSASAKKIKQTHKLEVNKGKETSGKRNKKQKIYIEADSLLADSIRFSGYDKPINAKKETFHLSNSTSRNLKKVGIRVTYLDLNGRMLHMRETEAECDIPTGETRLVSIPTWDRQNTFYYYLGPEPRRVATPYKTSISLLWIEF